MEEQSLAVFAEALSLADPVPGGGEKAFLRSMRRLRPRAPAGRYKAGAINRAPAFSYGFFPWRGSGLVIWHRYLTRYEIHAAIRPSARMGMTRDIAELNFPNLR